MTTTTTIMLKGGSVVPVEALQLAWTLESLGVEMVMRGDTLVVRPRRLIPSGGEDLIRRFSEDLKRLVVACNAESPV